MPLAVVALPALPRAVLGVRRGARPRLLVGGLAAHPRLRRARWRVAEWLRGHLFTGFPWNAFGYALTPMPLMMQSAALVGIWGLTLAAFFIFAAPALLADAASSPAAPARIVVAVAGASPRRPPRLRRDPPRAAAPTRRSPASACASSSRRSRRTSAGRSRQRRRNHAALPRSQPAAAPSGIAGVTHLIWPESAFPFLLTERPSALAAIADLLPDGRDADHRRGPRRAPPAATTPPLVFNSVYVIDDGGEIRAAYDKVHLVPFGEYLPFRGFLDALGMRQLIALPGGFSPGPRLRTLTAAGAPPFGPLICYEIIFPGAVVEPGNRPGWLLNLTNDAWYGDTPGSLPAFPPGPRPRRRGGLAAGPRRQFRHFGDRRRRTAGFSPASVSAGSASSTAICRRPCRRRPTARFGDLIFLGLLVGGGDRRSRRQSLPSNLTDN